MKGMTSVPIANGSGRFKAPVAERLPVEFSSLNRVVHGPGTLAQLGQIARELGIRVNQLRKWRLDFEEEERTGAPKRVMTSDDDLGRLRRENAKLKEENEILKKAAIYFARGLT